MDLRHSKATLLSLGAVDTTGVPALNQVARFFDADTVQGSPNLLFTGSVLSLTGSQNISTFLSIGPTPALSGSLRLPNAGSIVARNQSDNADLNMMSHDASANLLIGSSVSPRITFATGPVVDFPSPISLGATPALSGTIRLSNADDIVVRDQNNNFDFNVISFDASANMIIGDPGMPRCEIDGDITRLFSLQVDHQVTGARTAVVVSATTVLTPSGATATLANFIPAGAIVLGVTTRVITAVTGPAGFDVGDGVNTDRWGNSLAVGLNSRSDSNDFVSGAIEVFPALNDVVITSDGVNFTGGEIRVSVHYIQLTGPTS